MKQKINSFDIIANTFFWLSGLVFLFLAKAKHAVKGYSTPKTFSAKEYKKCLQYDIEVVDKWLTIIEKITKKKNYIEGKNILELGPGSDLGVGLILLSKKISKYAAIDVNNLIAQTPHSFYETLFQHLRENNNVNTANLEYQLKQFMDGKPKNLSFVQEKNFDIQSVIRDRETDIVISLAAFEHFDNPEKTIQQLSGIVKTGGFLFAEIDLRTHSRWIRDKDPINIYRYGEKLYNFFSFRGSPNRIRPYQYKKMLEKHGWTNISIVPLIVLEKTKTEKTTPFLNKKFQDKINQMDFLTIMVVAQNTN